MGTTDGNARVFGRRWGAGAVFAVLAVLLVATPSQAHSQEVASDPADKSKVSIVPAAVSLTFNENVIELGTRVQVTGPSGDVTDGVPSVTDNVVQQAVSADAPAGTYTVKWRVTSGDGHPVSGEFTFTAAEGALSQQSSTPVATPTEDGPVISTPPTPGPTATTVAAVPGSEDGGGMSGLAVIGVGAVVLAVVIAFGAAAARTIRSSRT